MQPDTSRAEFACPDCGSEVQASWTPPSYSLRCSKCGWSVATTRFPPIFDDKTNFKVFLVTGNRNKFRAVQAIKANHGGTTIDAKRLLAEPRVFLFEGRAVQIFGRLERLRSEGIELHIEPPFRYHRSDFMGMTRA